MNVYVSPIVRPLIEILVTDSSTSIGFESVPAEGVMEIFTPAKSELLGLFHEISAFPSLAETVNLVTSFGAVTSAEETGVPKTVTISLLLKDLSIATIENSYSLLFVSSETVKLVAGHAMNTGEESVPELFFSEI